jgi:diguanylate cyclase (GGDEF)-like protein
MPRQAWRKYLAILLAASGGFVLAAPGGWLGVWWQVVIGYSATAAILVGAWRNRRNRAAWCCFAVGVFANSTGILVEAIVSGVDRPGATTSPPLADAFYLIVYPAVALGLALLIRRHSASRNWGPLVEATMVLAGLGLPAWIFLIDPASGDPSLSRPGQVVSVVYPIGDVVLIVLMVRLLLGASRPRAPAMWLMTGSLVAFVCADTAWAVYNAIAWPPPDVVLRLTAATSLLAYVLFGGAALHPSAGEIGEHDRPTVPRVSIAMIGLFTAAALTAPGLLILQVAQHRVEDGLAIAVGCITLVLLAATRMSQLVRQLERQTTKVSELSYTDDLTGLPNRRAWTIELARRIERARRDGALLSVAMLDLDRFKRFNDNYGHLAGDRLLTAVGTAWRRRLRESNYLARYGGEEFLVLLPNVEEVGAGQVVDQLRDDTPLNQTFSAGIATWDGRETSDELVARADTAMYSAKQSGRNRTVLAR